MIASPLFRPWLGGLGMVAAVGILVGMLEPAGFAAAGTINALSYILWSAWLIATGVVLLRARSVVAEKGLVGVPKLGGRNGAGNGPTGAWRSSPADRNGRV